ncbi:hypothetical protein BaRGS_00005453, partial [Batillaria attramentaria]
RPDPQAEKRESPAREEEITLMTEKQATQACNKTDKTEPLLCILNSATQAVSWPKQSATHWWRAEHGSGCQLGLWTKDREGCRADVTQQGQRHVLRVKKGCALHPDCWLVVKPVSWCRHHGPFRYRSGEATLGLGCLDVFLLLEDFRPDHVCPRS